MGAKKLVPLPQGRTAKPEYVEVRKAVERAKVGSVIPWQKFANREESFAGRNRLYAHLRDQARMPAGRYFSVRRTKDDQVFVMVYAGSRSQRPRVA